MDTSSFKRVVVRVLTGEVSVDDRPVPLANRELELISALAMKSGCVEVDMLCDMLYPGLDSDRAHNATKVLVYRVRRKLSSHVIAAASRSYYLDSRVAVDLQPLIVTIKTLSCRADLKNDVQIQRLTTDASKLLSPAPIAAKHWEWFEPLHTALKRLGSETITTLAWRLLNEGQIVESLRLARVIVAADPCDEGAREVVINCLAAMDRPAAALTEYRRYAATLQEELGLEPSLRLRDYYRDAHAQRRHGAPFAK